MKNFKISNRIFGAIALVAIMAIAAVFVFGDDSAIVSKQGEQYTTSRVSSVRIRTMNQPPVFTHDDYNIIVSGQENTIPGSNRITSLTLSTSMTYTALGRPYGRSQADIEVRLMKPEHEDGTASIFIDGVTYEINPDNDTIINIKMEGDLPDQELIISAGSLSYRERSSLVTFSVRTDLTDDELRNIPYEGRYAGEAEPSPEIPEGLTVSDTRDFSQTDGNVYRVYIYSDGTESEAWIVGQKIVNTHQLDESGNIIPLTPLQ